MLSPRAISILLKYFDAIDRTVSQKMLRKRPWPEVALTTLLCDLLDAETQDEEKLDYTLQQVHEDFARFDEPVSLDCRIETLQYPPGMEHLVTQSDLGLILNYEDHLDRRCSIRRAWLFQAKRVFPSGNNGYSINSKFRSMDAQQARRMKMLRDVVGPGVIFYLLYCPRPSFLDPQTRQALKQRRTNALGGFLYHHYLGLLMREDAMSNNPSSAAGVFVGSINEAPTTLGETHAALFQACTPLSWFLVYHLSAGYDNPELPRFSSAGETSTGFEVNPELVERIVRGDYRALDDPYLESDLGLPILPRYFLEISIKNGLDR